MPTRTTRAASARFTTEVATKEHKKRVKQAPQAQVTENSIARAVKSEQDVLYSSPSTKTRKRKRETSKNESRPSKPENRPSSKALATVEDIKNEGAAMASRIIKQASEEQEEQSPRKTKKSKANPYGLSPGQSPFPDYPHPTPEECNKVVEILEKKHGKVAPPKTIPAPSLSVSGCGEVPSVLDALIRTRLSAATNNANSSRAFRGLVDTFGTVKKGIGKGSVDWDAVRKAPQKAVFEAIKSGGLADVKSKDIQKILQMVYEENQERSKALIRANIDKNDDVGPIGIKKEPETERKEEVSKAKDNVLSLDHLHLMSNEDAFDKLLGYPGIGPKTASCVLLFCLQRPSFAVDTHVFRLCKLLKWVPLKQKPTRNSTYAHCDVRIPDDLKYALHYLMIRHGKSCAKCSASLSKSGTCPLDSLMDRAAARRYKDGE